MAMRETFVVENLVGGAVIRKEFRKHEIESLKTLELIKFKGSTTRGPVLIKVYRPKGR